MANPDKVPADDQQLLETFVEGGQVFQGSFLKILRDTVKLPDGLIATREYVRHPGAVMVVPILDDGRLVLERQFRHPLGQIIVEFPAGKLDPGEPAWKCAQRELLEETGYQAAEWAFAGTIFNAAAYSTERIHIWLARQLVAGAAQLDEGELIETVPLSEQELDALACSGGLGDAKTLIGLQWLQKWRRGEWSLAWYRQDSLIEKLPEDWP